MPAETVRRSVVSLVCFGRLKAPPTGGGYRFDYQVEGLDDLTPLQLRVLKYHISDEVHLIHKTADDLGIDDDQLRTTVDSLVSAGHLTPLIDEDDKYYMATGRFLNGSNIGLNPFQQRVLDYYTQHATSDVGLATNAVAASLGVNLARLRAAVAFLSRKDYLYSTIDEDHHKSTI